MTDNSDEFDREEGRPDIPRRRKSYLKASLVFFGIGLCLLVPMLIAQSALLAVLAIAAGITGIVLLVIYFCSGAKKREKRLRVPAGYGIPLLALGLDFAGAAAFWLGVLCMTTIVLFAPGMILFFAAVAAPVAGMVFGIVGLCSSRKVIRPGGKVISAVAVALPVITVVTLIILFSTRVLVISLM